MPRRSDAADSIALCGAGFISLAHAGAAGALGLPIVAVASRTEARTAERAAQLHARASSFEDLPAGASIVVVSTPPAQHAPHALAMLDAGAAVLLEKPLCTTLTEADDLVAAAARHGERILYGENLAYAPVVAALLDRARAIGPLEHIEVRALQGTPTWGAFLTDEWGGGALFDLGVHPLAVALLLALPARATSVVTRLTGGDGHRTDVHADVDLAFDTGLTARVVSSWSAGPDSVWDAQASSATGVVRADLLPDPALEVNGAPVPLRPVDPKLGVLEQYGYVGQLRALVADVAGQRQPFMSVAFGRLVLDIVCAAYASAQTGEPESVPFTGRRDLTPLQLWRGA